MDPGDTGMVGLVPVNAWIAQRRPGRGPRRHWSRRSNPSGPCSAQRRPGRGPRRHAFTRSYAAACRSAQRRPGRGPRRHLRNLAQLQSEEPRSTKAGAWTPATPPRVRCGPATARPLNEGRGVDPGDTAPAANVNPVNMTRAQRRPGRGPRRHGRAGAGDDGASRRSTKAGAWTPATLVKRQFTWDRTGALNEGRGVDPGDT